MAEENVECPFDQTGISERMKQETEASRIQEKVEEAAAEVPDELERVRAQLAEAEAKVAEYLDGWQRERAEFANFRRRQEQMQSALRQQMVSRLVTNLIAVLDDQERAFAVVPEDMRNHVWVEGLALVGRKLFTTLEKEGLTTMEVHPGDRFDPRYHQAVLHEPSAEFEEGQVVQVLQKGYSFQDQVLRPAIVRVSSGRVERSVPTEVAGESERSRQAV